MSGKSVPQEFSIRSFGGLNLNHPRTIEDNEFRKLVNLMHSSGGALFPRPGLEWKDDDAHSQTFSGGGIAEVAWILGVARGTTSANEHYLASWDDKLYISANGGVTWTKLQYAAADVTDLGGMCINTGQVTYFTSAQGLLSFDGTTLTQEATAGVSNQILELAYFKNRFFGWKPTHNTVDAIRLYYSEIDDPTTGWVANYQQIDTTQETDKIQYVCPFNNLLYVFTEKETWAIDITGEPADWIVTNISKTYGAESPYSVIEVDGLLYILNVRGFFAFDGFNFQKLSGPLDPLFDRQRVRTPATRSHHRASIGSWVVDFLDWIIVKVDDTAIMAHTSVDTFIFLYNKKLKVWTQITFALSGTGPLSSLASSLTLGKPVSSISRSSVTDNAGLFMPYNGRTSEKTRALHWRLGLALGPHPANIGISESVDTDFVDWEDYWDDLTQDIRYSFQTKDFDFGSATYLKRMTHLSLDVYGDAAPNLTYFQHRNGESALGTLTQEVNSGVDPNDGHFTSSLVGLKPVGLFRTWALNVLFEMDDSTYKEGPFVLNAIEGRFTHKKKLLSANVSQ